VWTSRCVLLRPYNEQPDGGGKTMRGPLSRLFFFFDGMGIYMYKNGRAGLCVCVCVCVCGRGGEGVS
jgi:hypothetical protein